MGHPLLVFKSFLKNSLPTLDKAFLCFSLKTGTITIGVFTLITSFMAILLGSYIVGVTTYDYHPLFGRTRYGYYGYDDVGLELAPTILVLVISVIYVIYASLLIHGARKGRPGALTPWLVLTCVTMVLQVIGFFISLYWIMLGSPFAASIHIHANIIFTQGIIIYAHTTVLLLGTEAYLLVLVYSLRKQFQDGVGVGSDKAILVNT